MLHIIGVGLGNVLIEGAKQESANSQSLDLTMGGLKMLLKFF